MVICNRLSSGCSNTLDTKVVNSGCPDRFGCPSNVCPDFSIKRHDTLPVFKVSVEDCDGPLDLEGDDIVLEANMWANAKLKTLVSTTDTSFALADNIGFYQVMVNDIIIMDRIRLPEHMLVTAIDEDNKLIYVHRGYNGTNISQWAKGSSLRIFRMLNAPAVIEMVKEDITGPDGETQEDVLTATYLTYPWTAEDTCLPGCYWLEFKVFKQILTESGDSEIPSNTPSVEPSNIPSYQCSQPGFEWVRRFPQGEGFLIHIIESPTAEMI